MLKPLFFICLSVMVMSGSLMPLDSQGVSPLKADKVVEGDLVFPDGETAEFSVQEGVALTIRSKSGSYWYGIVPHILDEDSDTISFTVFTVTLIKDEEFLVEQLGSPAESVSGMPVLIATEEGSLQIIPYGSGLPGGSKIIGTSPRNLQKFGVTGGLCCVSCGGITVCGGSVVMSCDSCMGRPAM